MCAGLHRTQTWRGGANTDNGAAKPHARVLGNISGSGNGDYRGELLRASEVIRAYMEAKQSPPSQAIMRLDGLYVCRPPYDYNRITATRRVKALSLPLVFLFVHIIVRKRL